MAQIYGFSLESPHYKVFVTALQGVTLGSISKPQKVTFGPDLALI